MSFRKNDPAAITAIVLGGLGGLVLMLFMARAETQTTRIIELTPVVPAAPAPPAAPTPPKAPDVAALLWTELAPPAPPAEEDLSAEPTFTPYTVPPRMLNSDAVRAKLEEVYPPLLKDAGIGGSASIWLFITEDGEVLNTRISQSSGHEALDEAAMEVASVARFTAGMNRDQPVPVWISYPIIFQVR